MKQKLIFRKGVLIICFFLICLQYGCITNRSQYQRYQDMKELVIGEDAPGFGYLLFFKTDTKGKVGYREAYYIQSELYYSPKFKGIDIESFFKDIMFGKKALPCGDLVECFTLSPVIMDAYKRKRFDAFLNKYATCNEKFKTYTITPSLSYDEKLSVAYCFYLNNIYTSINTHSTHFVSQRVPLFTRIEYIERNGELIEIRK